MSDFSLDISSFPSVQGLINARWAPVILEPIAGSYERLVIGVVVRSDTDFHVAIANALERLSCLYGEHAPGLIFSAQLSLDHLSNELARIGPNDQSLLLSATSNVRLGDWREAQGINLQRIGDDWLTALSSLHSAEVSEITDTSELFLDDVVQPRSPTPDGLPALVLGYVEQHRIELAHYFNSEIRSGVKRRSAARAHETVIDFSGTRLTANFGTVKVHQLPKSVEHIKRRLWDLKVDRDRVRNPGRSHEMILQIPRSDDPQFTTRQFGRVMAAVEGLTAQADQEELRLRPLHTVDEIGQFLVECEAA